MENKTYTGSGDDVIDIEKSADTAATSTFTCMECSGNVVVKFDYDLLVNRIGSYAGTKLIDVAGGENTTTLEITADADWSVVIGISFLRRPPPRAPETR